MSLDLGAAQDIYNLVKSGKVKVEQLKPEHAFLLRQHMDIKMGRTAPVATPRQPQTPMSLPAPSPLSTLPIPDDLQETPRAPIPEGAGRSIVDFFAKRRVENAEAMQRNARAFGLEMNIAATPEESAKRFPSGVNQFVAGIMGTPPFSIAASLAPENKRLLEAIGSPQTTGETAARITGGVVGAIPLMTAASPLGALAAAKAAKVPISNFLGRLALQGAASGGVNVGVAEVIRQGVDAARGEDITLTAAAKAIGGATLGGAVGGAVLGVTLPYIKSGFERLLERFTRNGKLDVPAMAQEGYTVQAGSAEYRRLVSDPTWKMYDVRGKAFFHKVDIATGSEFRKAVVGSTGQLTSASQPTVAPATTPAVRTPISALLAGKVKPISPALGDLAVKAPIHRTTPSGGGLPQETVDAALDLLPPQVRESATKNVKGIRLVDDLMGGEGRFDQRTGLVYIDKANATPDVLAHELSHAYVYNEDNPALMEAFIKARYPAETAQEILGKGIRGRPNWDYFAQEDFTQALDVYRSAPDKLLSELRGVFDAAYEKSGQLAAGKTKDISPLRATEQRLASDINAAIPNASTLGAVAPPFQGQTPQQKPSFAFKDPGVEARFSEARKGVRPETLIDKIKEFATTLSNKATRVFEALPNTPEFAQAKFDLLKLGKQKGVVGDRTVRIQQGILADVMGDPEAFNLFERSVILNDLAQEANAGRMLPFGFNETTVTAEKARLDTAITGNANIQKALDTRKQAWDAIKNEYVATMDTIGFDVSDRFNKEDYFRHQVLEYAQNKGTSGAGGRLRTPTGRGFLKQRQGSEMDINANYLQAEFEVMAQMLQDIEIAKTINGIEKKYDISKKVKTEAKQQGIADWRDNVPEGFVLWQPREGNMFYHVYSIPEQIADQVLYGAGLPLDVMQREIGEGIAVGRRYKELVIPQELADTLDNLNKPRPDALSRLLRGSMNLWKQWQLTSLKRVFRYNIRNLSGDAEAVAVGNPRAFAKVPQAVRELIPVFAKDAAMSPEMRQWFERGGMESTLQAVEMGQVDKLGTFSRLFDEQQPSIVQFLTNATRKLLVEWPRLGTDLREGILRYAAYLDYLEQMQANNGVPLNYGASVPEEVMAIKDVRDKAFKMSNDLLGAYDEVSVLGQSIRQNLIPFWSWKELNFKRYLRFIRNAAIDPNVASKVAKGARIGVKLTGSTALRVGGFLVKATGLWGLLAAWNTTRFPEAERDLPEDVKKKPHIILYIDQDGKPVTFTRLGTLSDFLSMFGIDGPPQNMLRDFLNGKKTAQEIAIEMGKDFVNEQLVQGLRPDIKMFAETVAGKQIFPDVFKPRTIRDRGLYLAEQLGLGDEYKAIAGLPSRPYLQNLKQNIATYTYDPNQSAYYEIQDLKHDFLKKIGKEGNYSGTITPRSQALYNYKLAIRFEDKEAAQRYLKEYAVLGGTAQGLQTSLANMEPLHGLSIAEKAGFLRSLADDEKQQWKQAVQFYSEVLLGMKPKPKPQTSEKPQEPKNLLQLLQRVGGGK